MRKVAVLGRITFATTLVFSVWSFLSSKLYQYNKCDSLVQIVSLLEHHIMKNQVFKARIDVACNMSLEFSQLDTPKFCHILGFSGSHGLTYIDNIVECHLRIIQKVLHRKRIDESRGSGIAKLGKVAVFGAKRHPQMCVVL